MIRDLPRRVQARLGNTWELWAREPQIYRPGEYFFDVVNGGRGGGKSATGVNALLHVSRHTHLCGGRNGKGGRNAIAGRTFNDVYNSMIHGDSGIMRWAPKDFRPRHIEQKQLLKWPNGCTTQIFTGDAPASFRGPNIGWLWADELAHWIKLEESWTTAIGMVRLGAAPRILVTTTPTGVQTMLEILFALENGSPAAAPPGTPLDRQLQGFLLNPRTRVRTITMWDNIANLPAQWVEQMVATHVAAGTHAQELEGYVELGSPNALWQYRWIRRASSVPEPLEQVCLGIDPAATSSPTSAEWGLVVVGIGVSGTLYVLGDLSGHLTPEQAGQRVALAIEHLGCTHLAYEDNQGGDLVEAALRPTMSPEVWARAIKKRVHASRSKAQRAAIVAPLWNVGRVIHVTPEVDVGKLDTRSLVPLEYQMRNFDPSKPERGQPTDRMDALVWSVLTLVAGGSDRQAIQALGNKETWETILATMRRRLGT